MKKEHIPYFLEAGWTQTGKSDGGRIPFSIKLEDRTLYILANLKQVLSEKYFIHSASVGFDRSVNCRERIENEKSLHSKCIDMLDERFISDEDISFSDYVKQCTLKLVEWAKQTDYLAGLHHYGSQIGFGYIMSMTLCGNPDEIQKCINQTLYRQKNNIIPKKFSGEYHQDQILPEMRRALEIAKENKAIRTHYIPYFLAAGWTSIDPFDGGIGKFSIELKGRTLYFTPHIEKIEDGKLRLSDYARVSFDAFTKPWTKIAGHEIFDDSVAHRLYQPFYVQDGDSDKIQPFINEVTQTLTQWAKNLDTKQVLKDIQKYTDHELIVDQRAHLYLLGLALGGDSQALEDMIAMGDECFNYKPFPNPDRVEIPDLWRQPFPVVVRPPDLKRALKIAKQH